MGDKVVLGGGGGVEKVRLLTGGGGRGGGGRGGGAVGIGDGGGGGGTGAGAGVGSVIGQGGGAGGNGAAGAVSGLLGVNGDVEERVGLEAGQVLGIAVELLDDVLVLAHGDAVLAAEVIDGIAGKEHMGIDGVVFGGSAGGGGGNPVLAAGNEIVEAGDLVDSLDYILILGKADAPAGADVVEVVALFQLVSGEIEGYIVAVLGATGGAGAGGGRGRGRRGDGTAGGAAGGGGFGGGAGAYGAGGHGNVNGRAHIKAAEILGVAVKLLDELLVGVQGDAVFGAEGTHGVAADQRVPVNGVIAGSAGGGGGRQPVLATGNEIVEVGNVIDVLDNGLVIGKSDAPVFANGGHGVAGLQLILRQIEGHIVLVLILVGGQRRGRQRQSQTDGQQQSNDPLFHKCSSPFLPRAGIFSKGMIPLFLFMGILTFSASFVHTAKVTKIYTLF